MTQSVLEAVALAIYRQAWGTAADKRWHDDVKGRAHFEKQARAALIALRDGVTTDHATIEATLSDSEYGYGSFLEPFQNALNHVLQKGEKGKDSG